MAARTLSSKDYQEVGHGMESRLWSSIQSQRSPTSCIPVILVIITISSHWVFQFLLFRYVRRIHKGGRDDLEILAGVLLIMCILT